MRSIPDSSALANRLHTGLRFRMALMIVLTMLPVFGLMVYRTDSDRRRRLQELKSEAVRLGESCASSVAQVVEGTRQTLIALAYSDPMRTRNVPVANAFLADVLKHSRLYANLGLTRPDGMTVASGLPITFNIDNSTQPWYQRIQEKRSFTIGDFQISKITGKSGIVFAFPLPDQPDGQPLATVNASLNEEILQTCLSQAQLPPDGVLNIIDRNGTVLARNPNPQEWVGKASKAWPVFKAARSFDRSLFVETKGIDDTVRLYHFTEVPGTDGGLFVGMAVSRTSLMKTVLMETLRSLLWLGVATACALLAASYAGSRWVVHPVRHLRDVSGRLARGDLNARARIDIGSCEFQQLAADFDTMADTLGHNMRHLRESEEKFKAVTMSANDAILMIDDDGRIAYWNEAAVRMMGYSEWEAVGMEVFQTLFAPRYRDLFSKDFARFHCDGKNAMVGRTTELAFLRKDGAEVPIELSVSAVILNGRWNVIAIVRDITERKRAVAENERIHQQLMEASRQAGMAEVATNVLHNVGNALNNVNISANLISDSVRGSRAQAVEKITALLHENEDRLGPFFTQDEKGRHLLPYLDGLSKQLIHEHHRQLDEIAVLIKDVEHIKDIVAMQQDYARDTGIIDKTRPSALVEDAVHLNKESLNRHDVELVRQFEADPEITVEKHKVLQILVNLIRNAKQACKEAGHQNRRVTVRICAGHPDTVQIEVADNGVGIPEDALKKIFMQGYTTRKKGHGFGLHGSANMAREMGGSLSAHSDGPGRGASFVLEIPLTPHRPSHG